MRHLGPRYFQEHLSGFSQAFERCAQSCIVLLSHINRLVSRRGRCWLSVGCQSTGKGQRIAKTNSISSKCLITIPLSITKSAKRQTNEWSNERMCNERQLLLTSSIEPRAVAHCVAVSRIDIIPVTRQLRNLAKNSNSNFVTCLPRLQSYTSKSSHSNNFLCAAITMPTILPSLLSLRPHSRHPETHQVRPLP